VLILKEVKVVCFDTLLQVLILKKMEMREVKDVSDVEDGRSIGNEENLGGGVTPYPGCFRMSGKERTYATRRGTPPGCFAKRGCKLLKTKGGSRKTKVKRLQAIDKTRVRAGATGGVREVSSR
jgi:hypothetical protein